MIEKGLVTKMKNGEATVSLVPSENCSSCKGCSCGKGGNSMLMRVRTEREVQPGDIVTLEIQSRALLGSGFMVFVLPLIMFIIGTLSAAPIIERTGLDMDSNIGGIIAGLALMIITFALVFVFERRNTRIKDLEPRIIDVERRPPAGTTDS